MSKDLGCVIVARLNIQGMLGDTGLYSLRIQSKSAGDTGMFYKTCETESLCFNQHERMQRVLKYKLILSNS